jgi:cyclic-di-GMP phosphodiesterase TipF (flagellum assembly factor)
VPATARGSVGKEGPISRLAHLALALGYIAVALGLAFGLPAVSPAIDGATGLILGGFAFVLGTVLHEAIARRRSEFLWFRRMAALRRSSLGIRDELALMRDQARRLYEVLEGGAGSSQDDRRQIDHVVAEVKVLQSLVEQLHRQRTSAGGAEPGTFEQPAAAMPTDDAPTERLVAGDLDAAQTLDVVREGLARGSVDLYLQPIVSLPQRKRRFFECFSRIRAENGAIIGPEHYLELAEREGLITTIDNMLLFRCVQLVRRTQRHKYDVGFFCNISRHSLEDTAFFHDFIEFMEDNTELAPNLIFEFTQADLAAHDQAALRELNRLADLGFRFSVDQVADLDLNVTALASRRFAFVKVDADLLIREIGDNPPLVDVRDFKALLDQAGIDLIVEKIESEGQLIELLDFNIDYGQGYLFGQPRLAREA